MVRWMIVGVMIWTMMTIAMAQNLAPNGSFEQGTTAPDGWRLSGGVGGWEKFGRTGKRSISVTGGGSDSNSWECTAWHPEAGKLYLIRYFVRRDPNAQGGTPITGFSTINRDAWDIPSDGKWHRRQFVARTPTNRTDTVLRFGQWHVRGMVSYDDVEILPVVAVHQRFDRMELGSGESIRNGVYRFTTNFGWFGSEDIRWLAGNDSRPLFAHTAGFNSNRWVLGGPLSERWLESGAWVIYRHAIGFPFASATLHFVIGYYEGGQLVVEVSKDGKEWREIGRFSPSGEYTMLVPDEILPADELWVRFWATGVLQVNSYRMEARLNGDPPDATGETWYFAVARDTGQGTLDKGLEVMPVALTDKALLVLVRNKTEKERQLTIDLTVQKAGASSVRVTLLPNGEKIISVVLPLLQASKQVVSLTVREGTKIMAKMHAQVQKAWIEVAQAVSLRYLAETDALSLWWCEATNKVGRTTAVQRNKGAGRTTAMRGRKGEREQGKSKPIRIEAARNEYEPFQLVLTPKVVLDEVRLLLEPFRPITRHSSLITPIWDEVALVDYVPVTIPTDAWGAVSDYPDPLVTLWRRDRETGRHGDKATRRAIDVSVRGLKAKQNQPLWFTAFIPKGTPAGTYRAKVTIVSAVDVNGKPIPVPRSPIPIELRVFDFTLPDDTPLRTAYGVGIDNDWHRLRTDEQFRKVHDLYMQVCRRYRISPYMPHAYAPIRWEITGPRTMIDNGVLKLVIDRWQGRIATVTRKQGDKETRGNDDARYSPSLTLGGVMPVIEQFEKEGIGWESKGIGWVGTESISDIHFIERNERRIVMDITAERLTSQPASRKFSATVRVTVEAGKPYFAIQLRRLVNTDEIRWRVNVYFHLLLPDHPDVSSSVNTERYGVWLWEKIAFGAAGAGFRYSLRINPQTGSKHGDVMRDVGRWLEPGEAWEPENEPTATVFTWSGANLDLLAEFLKQVVLGKVLAKPGAVVGIDEQTDPQFRYDFTDFDVAMSRYLDEFRFNGFNFIILPDTLGGHPRFSPEYNFLYKKLMSPIIEHLKEKGWLSKAYCYWIDEPHTPEQYDLTKRGMASIKEACLGVRRLLTNYVEKFPSPTFYDFVDLWVPIINQFDLQRAKERQMLGEEVWWYVCTGPKQPYPNNFIDHPAITHRIRYWMAAKWNLDGDLYWSMTYYRGKGGRLRNPYEDGQSETPEGGYWGNGDGRLLYPPLRQPLPESAEPVIAPPIPSLRLVMIGEGIEDHIYLWLLQRLQEKGRKTEKRSAKLQAALKQADKALGALDRLIRSRTDYELDPQKLHAERRKIAEAIEQLTKLLGELDK